MRLIWTFTCPDNKLRTISEIATREIWRRISLDPRHHVQDLIAEFGQAVSHREYIVIGSRNPDSAVISEFVTTQTQPLAIEVHNLLRSLARVPIALIYADYFARLDAHTAI